MLFIVAPAVADKLGNRGVNGPEKRSFNAIPLWPKYDIEALYAYPEVGKLYHLFKESGAMVFDFYVRGKFDFKSIFEIYRLIKENEVNLVHTQGPGSLDLMAAIACKLANVNFVITRPVMLDDLKINNVKKAVFKIFDRLSVRFSSKVVAVSTDGEKRLQAQHSSSSNKIIRIFNGVRFWEEVTGVDKRKDVFSICMCGQLTVNKGWFDFLKLCEKLRPVIPELKAFIVGDGPLYQDIKSYILNSGLGDVVHMTGHVENVFSILKQADIYVMTSYREGLSVAVLEALMLALPLVVYDFPGSDDQVHVGHNGFIVKMGDVNGVVSKVFSLYMDRTKLNSMGQESKKLWEREFTEEVMVKKYANIYKELEYAK